MGFTFRQSTASQARRLGPFVDETDGVTRLTGLTIAASDIRISKAGAGAVAKSSGGATHDEQGFYIATFDATDSSAVGDIDIDVDATGALAVHHEGHVFEEAVYDALYAPSATGALPVSAGGITTASFADGAITAAKFAAGAFAAVWTVAERLLTAGTNIVLAKGTGVTGFNDLSSAEAQSAAAAALTAHDAPTNTQLAARTLASASYATAAALTTVGSNVTNVQARIPAVLSDGRMPADTQALNGTVLAGDGSSGNKWGPAP